MSKKATATITTAGSKNYWFFLFVLFSIILNVLVFSECIANHFVVKENVYIFCFASFQYALYTADGPPPHLK